MGTFQNYVEAKPLDKKCWNFAWRNGSWYALRQKKSEFCDGNSYGIIHLLLVTVAFEDRVQSVQTNANEVQTSKINVDHMHRHMKSYVHCIYPVFKSNCNQQTLYHVKTISIKKKHIFSSDSISIAIFSCKISALFVQLFSFYIILRNTQISSKYCNFNVE